ncbi:hypothetical protein CaCOL14_004560 [Colletotrichum acutatum]
MQVNIFSVFMVMSALVASSLACTPAGGDCTVGSSDCCLNAECKPHVSGRSDGTCGH